MPGHASMLQVAFLPRLRQAPICEGAGAPRRGGRGSATGSMLSSCRPRSRPRLASWVAASNADTDTGTERACSPSAAWHRPILPPARTFDVALKLSPTPCLAASSCFSV
jgi:hypothetical protein